MRITLSSIFRDAENYVPRYFEQVRALRSEVDVHLVVAEGDSRDDTFRALKERVEPGDDLVRIDHGGPRFGSVDNAQRWCQIAMVCNALLHHVVDPGDAFVYVESDLVWYPGTIVRLLADLGSVPAVAPMSMHHGNPYRFYDTWGHVKNGERFTADPPHHVSLITNPDGELIELDSAGSCFAVRPDLLHHVAWDPQDCIRGVGRSLRAAGASLWLDPTTAVYHP